MERAERERRREGGRREEELDRVGVEEGGGNHIRGETERGREDHGRGK